MLRELHERTGNGLTVVLFWDDEADTVILHVDDHGISTGTHVPAARALDAFHHPFLYVDPARLLPDDEPEFELEAVATGGDPDATSGAAA